MILFEKRAFTLVELIITIAILFIVSTIGLISYLKFLPGVRDANRVQTILNVNEAVEEYKLQAKLPKPENGLEIKMWIDLLWWQWDLSWKALETLWINSIVDDPLDDDYYSFYVDRKRKNLQLLAFLEESNQEFKLSSSIITSASALDTDYSARFPYVYGAQLWIYVNEENTPIQKDIGFQWVGWFDVNNLPTTQNFQSILNIDNILIGSGSSLISSNPIFSCKRIKQNNPQSKDGLYTLLLWNNDKKSVYCDMTTSWGGWTLVHKTTDNPLDLSGALNTIEWNPNWLWDGEYRLSIDYWKQLSTNGAMAINIRTDGFKWEDVTKGNITDISTSSISFSNTDPYRIFGLWVSVSSGVNSCTSGTEYWNASCCHRCVNYDTDTVFWEPNNAPMIISGTTSFQWSAIEWAWWTDDSNWHRLKKMWIFLR